MNGARPRRFITIRVVSSILLIGLSFALVIPNCIVPATGAAAAHPECD